jgi:hypothetical protein
MNDHKPWSRWNAVAKLVVCILFWWIAQMLVGEAGTTASNKLKALPVVPLVLSLVPVLELLMNSPFSQLPSRWNLLPSWKQWIIVLLVLVAFLLGFIVLSAIVGSAQNAA